MYRRWNLTTKENVNIDNIISKCSQQYWSTFYSSDTKYMFKCNHRTLFSVSILCNFGDVDRWVVILEMVLLG